jgi:hypothetical protein
MTSVSTTANRTVSNPFTMPSMKEIIIADAGEGVTKEPWRDKVDRAGKRDHTESKDGIYVTGHMVELITKDQPSRENIATANAGRCGNTL